MEKGLPAKKFKDFNIKPIVNNFIGEKIKINKVLNKEIKILDYRIQNSKFDKVNNMCLHLQIEMNDVKHILFTGSTILIQMIEKVDKDDFPFTTTIIEENEHFEFT